MGVRRSALLAVGVLVMITSTACTVNPSAPNIPIASPWAGRTVDEFGAFTTCSTLGGPVLVNVYMDGRFYTRVSAGSTVVSEGETTTYQMAPVAFTSAPLAPGTCFSVTVEILYNEPHGQPGDANFWVFW